MFLNGKNYKRIRGKIKLIKKWKHKYASIEWE